MKFSKILLTSYAIVCSSAMSQPVAEFAAGRVTTGGQSVKTGSKLAGNANIETAERTKAQISTDNVFVRAGSKTELFLNENKNELSLKRGVAFVSPDGRQRKKSFKLGVGNCNMKSKGSALVSHVPDEYVKVTCIEGTMKVKLNAFMGDSVSLRQGEMVVVTPTDKKIASPKIVNLKKLTSSSALLATNSGFPRLPSGLQARIAQSISSQQKMIAANIEDNVRDVRVASQQFSSSDAVELSQTSNNNQCVFRQVAFLDRTGTVGSPASVGTQIFANGFDAGPTEFVPSILGEEALPDLSHCSEIEGADIPEAR